MAGGYHRYNGNELGQTQGDGEGQGGLACCSPWGHEEAVMPGRLNNKEKVQCSNYLKFQRTSTNTV